MSVDLSNQLELRPASTPVEDTRPWPRYFARMLDVLIFSVIVAIALFIPLMFADPVSGMRVMGAAEGLGGTVLSNIVSPLLAMLPIALLLAYGQTPGKWLFGIRVRDREGRRATLSKLLKRECLVWFRGWGFGIPVVSLYTLVMSHGDLKTLGTTPWDRSLDLVVEHATATPFWWIRATIGAALVLAAIFWSLIDTFASGL